MSLYKQTNVYTNVIEISVILIKQSLLIYKPFRPLYMSCNVISQKNNKPLTTQYFFTYLLLSYLFTKIESG